MTQKEKQLLLRDLCGRLPYGVKMKYKDDSGYEVLCQIDTFYKDIDGFHCLLRTTGPYGGFQDLNELKPYLRPMSSMTEEEKQEYHKQVDIDLDRTAEVLREQFETGTFHPENRFTPQYCHIDWLISHYFDYRGLIEKGLALEAPEGMYKIE